MEQNLDPHGIRPPKARSCEQFQGQLFKNENSFEEWKRTYAETLNKLTFEHGLKMRIPLRSGNNFLISRISFSFSKFKNENSFEEWKPSF